MIENDRQYEITKEQANRAADALAQYSERPVAKTENDRILEEAAEGGMRSFLHDLQMQMEDYEARQSCKYVPLTLWSFEEIPQLLMSVRIGYEMSHAEFAGRLGIDEEQLRCYEATEYASATMAEITRMLRALDIRVRSNVLAPPSERVFGAAMTR